MLIDIHCHIDMCKRPAAEVVAGNVLVIANGTNLQSNKKVLSYAKMFPNVHAALGLYPSDAIKLSDKEISETLNFIEKNKDKIVAIGEAGIDFYHITSPKEQKKECEVFKQVIQLANKIKKPLIVHSRKATETALELLKTAKVPVIMHCFEGNAVLTHEAVERGYFFTIPANFWTRKGFKNAAKRIPIERLLTETDAPFLSPIEGENQPQNVKFAVEKLAEIKGLSREKVEKQIYTNAKKLGILT